jgi:hypothetical protein
MPETHFHTETPPAVRRILESARQSGTRLRVFYGDAKTGAPWLEESDVLGRIGRSMGPVRVPLILARANSSGGPALLESLHCRNRDGAGALRLSSRGIPSRDR